jgi:hypothetical protein
MEDDLKKMEDILKKKMKDDLKKEYVGLLYHPTYTNQEADFQYATFF